MHSKELCLFAFRYDPWAKRIADFSILSAASLQKFVTHCCDFVCSHTCTFLSVRNSNVIISVCIRESKNLFKIELQEMEEFTRQGKLFPFTHKHAWSLNYWKYLYSAEKSDRRREDIFKAKCLKDNIRWKSWDFKKHRYWPCSVILSIQTKLIRLSFCGSMARLTFQSEFSREQLSTDFKLL